MSQTYALLLHGGAGVLAPRSYDPERTHMRELAEAGKAIKVAYNAKTQRYGTCNTTETLLVANAIAQQVLPQLAARYQDAGVELRGCELALHAAHVILVALLLLALLRPAPLE